METRKATMTATEEAKRKIETSNNYREQIMDETRVKVARTEEALAAAHEELEKSVCNGDEALYQKSQNEIERLQQLLKRQKDFLQEINLKPLITDEDYNRLCDGIAQNFAEYDERIREQLAGLCDKIHEIEESYKSEATRINDVLRALQVDVYRCRDGNKDRDGQYHINFSNAKRVNFTETLNWAQIAIKSPHYRRYKGLPAKMVGFR